MPIQDETDIREGSRIAKVMARAGLCSRRDAEQWIAEGRVSVNGAVLTSPAFNVSDADDVRVDGEPLRAAERTRLFLFHKPRGLVTTAKDPEGRSTIFDALPEDLPRVVAVGRLDINTEGLLLLTNDGGLSRVLELPATGWLRRYRVRAHGEITQEQLDGLRNGISIDGVDYLGIEAKFERQQGSNVWLTMGLREGKNREIKRVLEHMGLSVNRLIRVSFGPFELGDLPEGEMMEVRTRVLRDQLGPKLSKQAGANFEAAVETPEPPRGGAPARGDMPLRRPRAEPAREDAPRKRKHVTVLRAEAKEEAAGPRKRVTRTATADRKGRQVQVERVSLANPPPEVAKRPRRPSGEGFAQRPPREGFEKRAPRDAASGDRAPRRAPGEGFEKRAPRDAASGDRRPDRAPRRPPGEGFDKRPPRDAASGERRFDRAPRRAPGEGFDKRPPRDAASGDRRFDRAPRRPPGEGFDKRPPRDAASDDRRPDRAPRRATGEGFEKRAPREGASGDRRPDRAPRRPPGEGFDKRPPRDAASGDRRPDRAPRRPPGEGFDKRPPRDAASGDRRPDRAPRRPPGEGFDKRAPRDAASADHRSDRAPRRPPGEGFDKRPPRDAASGDRRPDRAPRRPPGEGFDKRPPREGASGDRRPDRAPRRPPGEGFAKPTGAPRKGPPRAGKPGGGKGPPRRPRG